MSAIELESVAKRFGSTPVLRGVDLSVSSGSLTAVLGSSGSGKTTLLRLIAGFEQVDDGTLRLNGQPVDDGRRMLSPQHRGIGYVPQEGALFPHLTVTANIAFGLSRGKRGKVRDLLELIDLTELAKRYPHQLSGGQQQRVALARALAVNPDVVLLDEPFGALDASLRGELRRDVTRILTETGTTAVLVTHDQDEALALADQVVLLADGRVRAAAAPRELYRNPPDETTATSIGEVNILPAHASSGHARCALGSIPISRNGGVDGASRLLLRPEQLVLYRQPVRHVPRGSVIEVQYHGHDALARVRLRGDEDRDAHAGRVAQDEDRDASPGDASQILLARVPGDLALEPGQEVWIEVAGAGRAWSDPPPDCR